MICYRYRWKRGFAMIRSEIIKIIGEVLGNKEGFWLITGAAMVMYGIKLNTTDIDIGRIGCKLDNS